MVLYLASLERVELAERTFSRGAADCFFIAGEAGAVLMEHPGFEYERSMSNICRHTMFDYVISLPQFEILREIRNDGRTASEDSGRGV